MHKRCDSCHRSGASGLLSSVGGGRPGTDCGLSTCQLLPISLLFLSVTVTSAERALAVKGG